MNEVSKNWILTPYRHDWSPEKTSLCTAAVKVLGYFSLKLADRKHLFSKA